MEGHMKSLVLGLVLFLTPVSSPRTAQFFTHSAVEPPFVCPITTPAEPMGLNDGNKALVTSLYPEGAVVFKPGGPGFVMKDGALSMKFGWWRLVPGRLTITGQRLDGPAPPLRARIPEGYGDIGFQSGGIVFPTPGCWEVTGHVGDRSLTFVTLVVKIGDGPARRGDW